MHPEKAAYLEELMDARSQLDHLIDVLEDISDKQPLDDLPSFFEMRAYFRKITGNLLPLSLIVMYVTEEAKRIQAERN